MKTIICVYSCLFVVLLPTYTGNIAIPKFRRKALFGILREAIGPVFRELAREKESTIIEGHVMPDHVHMPVAVPPKSSVSSVVGFLKGKSAIWIARHTGRRQNFTGQAFWARGFSVSTVGADEETIHAYMQRQEEVDRSEDQLDLPFS